MSEETQTVTVEPAQETPRQPQSTALAPIFTDLPGIGQVDATSVARAMASSGYFDARTTAQALSKILVGKALGLTPWEALTGIHMIEGKLSPSSSLLASVIRRHPAYDYKIVLHTDRECAIEIVRGVETLGVSKFTIEDAQRAGLINEKRPGWKRYPKNYLFARALSNAVRFYCPDVLGGPLIEKEDDVVDAIVVDAATGEILQEMPTE